MTDLKSILTAKPECLVLAGSAGAFDPVFALVSKLPLSLPFPVILVLHRGKDFKSNLRALLQSKSKLKIKEADDKEQLKAGTVYIAPVDFHLLVEPEKILSLDASEPIKFCRPAIDATLFSAADAYGKGLVALIFSGANDDGADGAAHVEKKGGHVFVQKPEDADVVTMPLAAIKKLQHPHLFNKKELVPTFLSLAEESQDV